MTILQIHSRRYSEWQKNPYLCSSPWRSWKLFIQLSVSYGQVLLRRCFKERYLTISCFVSCSNSTEYFKNSLQICTTRTFNLTRGKINFQNWARLVDKCYDRAQRPEHASIHRLSCWVGMSWSISYLNMLGERYTLRYWSMNTREFLGSIIFFDYNLWIRLIFDISCW